MLQTCLHEISTMNMPYNYMYKAFLQAIVYREIFALLNPCEFLCEYCGRGCNHVCLKEINEYFQIMVIYKYLKAPCYLILLDHCLSSTIEEVNKSVMDVFTIEEVNKSVMDVLDGDA